MYGPPNVMHEFATLYLEFYFDEFELSSLSILEMITFYFCYYKLFFY